MKSLFRILGVVHLLSVATSTTVSQFSCLRRNLSVTVDDQLRLYIDGFEITGLPNVNIWNQPDVVDLPCTTRLIAIRGGNLGGAAGILASTDDDYVLTNSSWKCSNISHPGWEEIDFDDSAWQSAIEYGRNGEGGWGVIPGISSNAEWIWLRQFTSAQEPMDNDVYCRKNLDPSYCTSSPCLSGATCVDETSGGFCICVPGYTGQSCSSVINNCESFPCLNGGTCVNGINYFMCACPPQWTGVRCDTLLNPCDGILCANGGSCLNNCGVAQCICRPEWTGTLCIDYIDSCSSSPCRNGGSCQVDENGWICICPPSLTGLVCEQIIDLCASSPCLHGSTCIFDCGIHQCICRDGWTGDDCSSLIDACVPNPCLNGGNCSNLPSDSFACDCPVDWTGVRCESPNYDEAFVCGTLLNWSEYNASNGFTRLCYFYAAVDDIQGRTTECRYTIDGLPLYDDYIGLLQAGGNFGCVVSQNYPEDPPVTSRVACEDDYQQDVSLGDYPESDRIMVCIRYPYEGEPGGK